jgi:two-component system cell cycle response regulator CtrA
MFRVTQTSRVASEKPTPKEMFLNHLYGGMDEPELKIIDVFICKLRKKLSNATDGENHIETVWGRGYVLRDPEVGANEERIAVGA